MVTRIVDESPGFKSLMLPSFLAEEPCNTHELTYEKKKDREGRKEKKGGREKEKKRDRERDRTRGKEKRYDRIEDEAHERQERMEKIRDDAQILVARMRATERKRDEEESLATEEKNRIKEIELRERERVARAIVAARCAARKAGVVLSDSSDLSDDGKEEWRSGTIGRTPKVDKLTRTNNDDEDDSRLKRIAKTRNAIKTVTLDEIKQAQYRERPLETSYIPRLVSTHLSACTPQQSVCLYIWIRFCFVKIGI